MHGARDEHVLGRRERRGVVLRSCRWLRCLTERGHPRSCSDTLWRLIEDLDVVVVFILDVHTSRCGLRPAHAWWRTVEHLNVGIPLVLVGVRLRSGLPAGRRRSGEDFDVVEIRIIFVLLFDLLLDGILGHIPLLRGSGCRGPGITIPLCCRSHRRNSRF